MLYEPRSKFSVGGYCANDREKEIKRSHGPPLLLAAMRRSMHKAAAVYRSESDVHSPSRGRTVLVSRRAHVAGVLAARNAVPGCRNSPMRHNVLLRRPSIRYRVGPNR